MKTRYRRLDRRAALRAAYDREADVFRCQWSRAPLEERDRDDPFFLCFDHYIPVRSSRLIVSSMLFNQMRTELGPEEFPRAIRELARHRAGNPFRRSALRFKYWELRAPSPPRPRGRPRPDAPAKVLVKECVICGGPPSRWSYYCPRCRGLVWAHKGDQRMRVRALRAAWDPRVDGFRCHYTGVRVDELDPRSPWYITFDHQIPGDDDTLVVAAYWVNLVKTALSEQEFWAVVAEYDKFLNRGGEFDRDVVEFTYWRRTRQRG